MKKSEDKTLQDRFHELASAYVEAFLLKHGYEEDGVPFSYDWMGFGVGDAVDVSDHIFGFDDIRYDIDEDVEVGVFEEWYAACDARMLSGTGGPYINYRSWVKGARYRE